MGQSPPGDSYGENGIEFHQGKINFEDLYIKDSGIKTINPKKIVEPDTILMSVRAPVGPTNITKRMICIGRGLCGIKPILCNCKYFLSVFRVFESEIKATGSGSTFDSISTNDLKEYLMPLPPFSQQAKIVSAIDELMIISEYHSCIINKTKQFSSMIKSQVVSNAIRGKLTRQKTEEKPVEINCENPIIRRDNSYYEVIGKNDICIDEEIPFSIPENWQWCRLNTIATKIVDGSHNPPKGSSDKTNFIMISACNINNNSIIINNNVRYLNEVDFQKENKRTQLKDGDVLLTIVGTIGRSCVFHGNNDVTMQRSISVITPTIESDYLKIAFDSTYLQETLKEKSIGTAQLGVYLNVIKQLLIPVPPISEQERIVSKVKDLQSLLDALE